MQWFRPALLTAVEAPPDSSFPFRPSYGSAVVADGSRSLDSNTLPCTFAADRCKKFVEKLQETIRGCQNSATKYQWRPPMILSKVHFVLIKFHYNANFVFCFSNFLLFSNLGNVLICIYFLRYSKFCASYRGVPIISIRTVHSWLWELRHRPILGLEPAAEIDMAEDHHGPPPH